MEQPKNFKVKDGVDPLVVKTSKGNRMPSKPPGRYDRVHRFVCSKTRPWNTDIYADWVEHPEAELIDQAEVKGVIKALYRCPFCSFEWTVTVNKAKK